MKKTSLNEDQERMQLFQGQLKQMNEDYDFMKRNREQAKKQLEARFQDIQRKIQNSKDFITAEGKRINDTLYAFQHKFEHDLKATKDDFNQKLTDLTTQTDNNFNKANADITGVSNRLNEQKADRIKQFEENAKDIKEKLDKLFEMAETEKTTRVQRQTIILGKLSEEVFKMQEAMKAEKDERNLKVKELRDFVTQELTSQTKYNEEFHAKNFKDFSNKLGDLEKQMNIRFSNKDQIINSLSKVVRTLQDTLRHPN